MSHPRRLVFSAPSHDDLDAGWPRLANAMATSADRACRGKVDIALGPTPVFGPGIDSEASLLRLEEDGIDARTIRVDRWCTFADHGAVAVTLGPGIRRAERRALLRALGKKALTRQPLIHEHEGPFHRDDGVAYGYPLDVALEDARREIDSLLTTFPDSVLLGEVWMLRAENEVIDTDAYDIFETFGPDLARFVTRDDAARDRLLRLAPSGQGLIALDVEDEMLDPIVRDFGASHDLTLLTQGPAWNQRITVGRGRPEDHLVVVYHAMDEPEVDAPLAFMI